MNIEQLKTTIDGLSAAYIPVWEDICNIESPTGCKAGVDAVGRYLIDLAGTHGWAVEVCPQTVSGDAVCITMNPEADGEPIVFSGHMDTVHPIGSFGSPAVRIEGERIYGPGVTDCKGGIAASLLAMDALERCGFTKRPVKLILQSDEENSSITSGKATVEFMAEKAKGCIAFLNTEQHADGMLCVGRKGIIRYELTVTGHTVHSAHSYEGASAICEAAHKVIALEQWKDEKGITSNCGLISGGTAANTVPETCRVVADIRYKTWEQLEEVKAKVQEIADTSHIPGTTCALTIKSQRCCMEKTAANVSLAERLMAIYREHGLHVVGMDERKGGSDAADMTAHGLPCVDSIGVCGGRIHSVEEYAHIPSLAEAAKRLALAAACL